MEGADLRVELVFSYTRSFLRFLSVGSVFRPLLFRDLILNCVPLFCSSASICFVYWNEFSLTFSWSKLCVVDVLTYVARLLDLAVNVFIYGWYALLVCRI